MVSTLLNWLFGLIDEFTKFSEWLITDLDHIGFSPLALISFGGLTLIISFLVVRLVIGG